MIRVEIWDRQNSTRLGIARASSAVLTRAIARGESLSVSLAASDPAAEHLSEGAVLRVQTEGDADNFTLWRVSSVSESRSEQDAHTIAVEADALWMDLRHGRVRQAQADGSALFAFGLVGLTPLAWITDIILPWADADVLSFQVGTVEAGTGVDLSFESASPIAALRMLEQATRGELQFRYSADGQTCYVDLLQRIGQSEGASELRYGKNIRGLERTVDYSEVATRLYAKGGGALTLADATWEIASKSGTSITFAGKSPVFEDGAFVGLYYYVPGKGGYPITASSKASGAINVDGAGLSAGDVGYIATDSAGARMAYLESPSGRGKFGVAVGDLAATDIPDATNLVPNGDLSEWAGALPNDWTAEGAATVAKVTSPLYSKYGETAAHVTGAAAGDGLLSPAFTILKPASRPYTGMLAGLTVVSGRVRAELRHSNGNVYPVAEQPGSEGLGVYLTLKAGPVHDEPLPDGTAQIAIVAHGGPAEWYLDTAMATPQIGGDVPEFVADSGAWLLWDRTADELTQRAREKRAYQVAIADLHKIDPARFRFEELGLGNDAKVRDPDFGAETLRIVEITEDLLRPEATRLVVAADPWSRPADEVSEVLPRYGQSRSFRWADAGKKNTAYILSADAQYDPADDKVYVRALGSAAVATIELRTKASRTAAYPVVAEQVLSGREGTFVGKVLPASDSLFAQLVGLDGRGVAGEPIEVSLRDVGDTLGAELADLQQEIADLDTYIDTVIVDDYVSEAERAAVKEQLKQIEVEKADILAAYAALQNSLYLSGVAETNLTAARDDLVGTTGTGGKYAALISAINALIANDEITTAERDAYAAAYAAYGTSHATFVQREEEARNAIAVEVEASGNDYADDLKADTDLAIAGVTQDVSDLETTVNTTFRDGVITESEANSIRATQNALESTYQDMAAQYATILANPALAGAPASNLTSSWSAYDSAYDTLSASITTAIADGAATEAEADQVNSDFAAHNVALGSLSESIQDAIDAIGQARKPIAQYSAVQAGTSPSSTFVAGTHEWARFSYDGGTTWTDWFRIVGEAGAPGEGGPYTDYRFKVATTQPATPTGAVPAGWSDAPPPVNVEAGEKLWMTLAVKAADGTLMGVWSPPVDITGPPGPEGPPGPQGEQGIQGPAGADGESNYFHIAYADSADGTVNFNQSSGAYVGTYVDGNPTDSADPAAYSWQTFQGAQGPSGDQGIAGVDGVDGETSYLHIAYADDAVGGGFSQDPTGKAYIGNYVDFVQQDSTNPALYNWQKVEGPAGPPGPPGEGLGLAVLGTRWRVATAAELILDLQIGTDVATIQIQYDYPSTPGGLEDLTADYTFPVSAGRTEHLVEDAVGAIRFFSPLDQPPNITITAEDSSGAVVEIELITPEPLDSTGQVGGRVSVGGVTGQADRVAFDSARFSFSTVGGRPQIGMTKTPWSEITAGTIPAYASRWPSWSEVTSKPSTFAPSAHNHSWSNITSGVPVYATRWPTPAEVGAAPAFGMGSTWSLAYSDGSDIQWLPPGSVGEYLNMGPGGTLTWTTVSGTVPDPAAARRFLIGVSTSSWASSGWALPASTGYLAGTMRVLYATATGDTAFGPVSWSDVVSKPSTFTPSAHNHDWSSITGEPVYTTRWPTWAEVSAKPSTFEPTTHGHYPINVVGFKVDDIRGLGEDLPNNIGRGIEKSVTAQFSDEWPWSSTYYSALTVRGWTTSFATWQLAAGSTTNSSSQSLIFRTGIGTVWNTTNFIWHSGNDGNGSGLDADMVRGYPGYETPLPTSTALRTSDGDLYARLFRSEYTSPTTSTELNYVMVQHALGAGGGVDNYVRPASVLSVKTAMGLGKLVEGGASAYAALTLVESDASGYAGIQMGAEAGSHVLMFDITRGGLYSGSAWSWGFDNGVMFAGSVPAPRVSGGVLGGSSYRIGAGSTGWAPLLISSDSGGWLALALEGGAYSEYGIRYTANGNNFYAVAYNGGYMRWRYSAGSGYTTMMSLSNGGDLNVGTISDASGFDIAHVRASSATPSGTAPDGTLWIQY